MIKRVIGWKGALYVTIMGTLLRPPEDVDPTQITNDDLKWQIESPSQFAAVDGYMYALLKHEQRHTEQQGDIFSFVPWAWKYLTNKAFRWEQERECLEIQVGLLKKFGLFDDESMEILVKYISQSMLGKEDAKFWLENVKEAK